MYAHELAPVNVFPESDLEPPAPRMLVTTIVISTLNEIATGIAIAAPGWAVIGSFGVWGQSKSLAVHALELAPVIVITVKDLEGPKPQGARRTVCISA